MISLDNDNKEENKMKRLSFSSQSSYESDDDEDDLDNINKMYDINNYQDMGLDVCI